jgi:hypothetical protein
MCTGLARNKPGFDVRILIYYWKLYSGTLFIQSDTYVRAIHCNGRHHSLPEGDQDVVYMVTCFPFSAHEDLKVLIREDIYKLCPPGLV